MLTFYANILQNSQIGLLPKNRIAGHAFFNSFGMGLLTHSRIKSKQNNLKVKQSSVIVKQNNRIAKQNIDTEKQQF